METKSKRLISIICDTISKGGKVIIPSFTVGRTQEILYEIAKEISSGSDKARMIQNVEIFVDSPLATSASSVYKRHIDYFDEEAVEFIKKGIYPLEPENLKFVCTSDESKMLNDYEKSCIIISSSGMCEAGRIKHHLKHNLWKENNTILFVGYQAPNTLGRRLLDGQKRVKIFGEEIEVRAKIEYIEAYSGHADKNGLITWIDKMKEKPKQIFVVHGEKESQIEFARELERLFGVDVHIPARGEFYQIGPDQIVTKDRLFSPSPSFINLSILAQIEDIEDELYRLKEHIKSASISPERLNLLNNNLEELRYLINLALNDY
ncbi:MBL fold metallo-hydrolase [Caldicellulosiruptor morganii]|uniref:MBL fold metallo-hydrolase n=1 Tax=Caldicellulosiruptor morganii TaxID=1387555 RepID=A0ABY7BJA8_9FIRM|nr:MBL fold metallo-hydrolase [Caldicellulosiruptor morganii]